MPAPASQIVSRSETSDFDEVTDVELVAFIRHEAELLSDAGAGSVTPADLDPEYDWEL